MEHYPSLLLAAADGDQIMPASGSRNVCKKVGFELACAAVGSAKSERNSAALDSGSLVERLHKTVFLSTRPMKRVVLDLLREMCGPLHNPWGRSFPSSCCVLPYMCTGPPELSTGSGHA